MAEEAVVGEPVSARLFPVIGENTGKFAHLGLKMTEVHRLSAGNTIAYEQNSLAAEAGKICSRTGNFEGHNSERAAQRPRIPVSSHSRQLLDYDGRG